MAITDNSFTKEEFLGAAQANPDLTRLVAGVITETENNPFRTLIEPSLVGPVTKRHAESLEADVKSLTGIEKKQDEKYYDYFKRAVQEKLGVVSTMETELKELREKGHSNQADKQRISALEKAIADTKDEMKSKLNEKDQALNKTRASYEVRNEIGKLQSKYKPGLPESLVKIAEQSVIDKLASEVVFQEDGTPTFLNEKKEVALDPQTFKPISIEQRVMEMLKDIVDTGKQQPGGGTKPPITPPGGTPPNPNDPASKYSGIPDTVKTKVQLSEYLLSLGITADNPKFDEILDHDGKGLRIK
jgi:hypothetical protein